MRTRTSAVSYSGQTWIFISGRVTPGFTDSYPSGAGRTREAVELSPAVEEVVSSAQAGSAAVTRRTNIAKIITESFAGRPLKIRANDITRRLAPLERPRICIINHPPLAITTPPCPGPDPGAHSYHWGDHQPRAPTTTPHLHQPEQESHLSVAVASSPGRPASWYGRIPQGISPLPPVPGTTRKDCRPPPIIPPIKSEYDSSGSTPRLPNPQAVIRPPETKARAIINPNECMVTGPRSSSSGYKSSDPSHSVSHCADCWTPHQSHRSP